MMIDDRGTMPAFGKTRACGRKASPRFAGNNEGTDTRLAKINPLDTGDFGKVQRVGWSATKHGAFIFEQYAISSAVA